MGRPPFYHVAKCGTRDNILRSGLLPTVDSAFVTGGVLTFNAMPAEFIRALLDSGRTPAVNLTDDFAQWAPRGNEVMFEVAIDDDDPNLRHVHRWWWRYSGIIRPDKIRMFNMAKAR